MKILNRHWLLGFVCGIVCVVLLEAGALFLFMNGMAPLPDAADELALPQALHLDDFQGALHDLDGKQLTFADLRGKVVILNLWATWCPPCRAEMPSLDHLHAAFAGQDVAVICVSEEPADEIRKHPIAAQVRMPLYVFADKAPQELNTRGLPITYIFDRTGRAVFSHTGMATWDAPHVLDFVAQLAERQ